VYSFIRAEKANFPVRTLCKALGVSHGAYYEWEANVESERRRRDAELLADIRTIFDEGRGCYGAPRIHDALTKRGVQVSRKRVARLLRENGLRARAARKFKATTDSRHSLPVSPNLLARNFAATRPNTTWVSDITYLWTLEGWMYLCVIIDLYSRKVVGWALRSRMQAGLVCEAFDMAVRTRRPAPGLVFHSDRGSQYASGKFRRRLARHGMMQSMSRKGNCWDNAVAESFFATLKKELVRDHVFETRDDVITAIFEYIEVFYNRRRTHSLLSYVTPCDFESCVPHQQAA
jgi:putative transposase